MNSWYQGENNNMMDTNGGVGVKEHTVPKISSYLNSVDTVLAVNQLQNECKKDSSVVLNLWNKLNSYTLPFAPCKTNLLEQRSQVITLPGNKQIDSASKDFRNKERDSELDFRLNSQQSSKGCLEYIRPIRPVLTSFFEENRPVTFLKQTCERSWKKKCETESDFTYFFLNSKQYQETEDPNCIEQCQNRPPANFSFQRLDSGIEDPVYPRRTRCQIDLNSKHLIDSCFVDSSFHCTSQIDLDRLYISTMIRTAANRTACLGKDGMGGVDRIRKSISFFIDIRDPLEQKPLGEKYKFLVCEECDSMFSDKCSDSYDDDDDYSDDDFIFFHESSSEETDGCGFNFTLNTCNPAELSCSVSANSTSRFDISMNTSVHQNSGNANKESCVSLKIGVRPGGIGQTSDSHKLNSSDADECVDCDEFTSEITYTGSLKTFAGSFCVSNNSSESDVSPVRNSYHEVTNGNLPSDLKTTPCHTEKKKSRKKVCFQKDDDLVKVHQMVHWDFAYREARKGTWELEAVDRCRFMRRIHELEEILSPCMRRKLELIQNT
jgi:hypothetical protein